MVFPLISFSVMKVIENDALMLAFVVSSNTRGGINVFYLRLDVRHCVYIN